MSGPFEQFDQRELAGLIDAFPLASVITCSGDFAVSTLPILVEANAAGEIQSLLGHVPKTNPHCSLMQAQPRTLFVFSGPQGYISPEFVATSRAWAPTWNFAVVHAVGDVVLDDALTDEAIEKLVRHMERGRPQPWSSREMGERYHQLKERVIGFRATIVRIEGRFKLGQDERPEVLSSILEHLDGSDLAGWMRRYNLPAS
jgi:transcriptional regulator